MADRLLANPLAILSLAHLPNLEQHLLRPPPLSLMGGRSAIRFLDRRYLPFFYSLNWREATR